MVMSNLRRQSRQPRRFSKHCNENLYDKNLSVLRYWSFFIGPALLITMTSFCNRVNLSRLEQRVLRKPISSVNWLARAGLGGLALALTLSWPVNSMGTASATLMLGTPARANETESGKERASLQLDLVELEQRLRATKAVGVLTKLQIKNQTTKLLDELRGYHNDKSSATAEQLHERYNLLVNKILTLVQDKDPELAHDLVTARENLWNMLADPIQFAKLNG